MTGALFSGFKEQQSDPLTDFLLQRFGRDQFGQRGCLACLQARAGGRHVVASKGLGERTGGIDFRQDRGRIGAVAGGLTQLPL